MFTGGYLTASTQKRAYDLVWRFSQVSGRVSQTIPEFLPSLLGTPKREGSMSQEKLQHRSGFLSYVAALENYHLLMHSERRL